VKVFENNILQILICRQSATIYEWNQISSRVIQTFANKSHWMFVYHFPIHHFAGMRQEPEQEMAAKSRASSNTSDNFSAQLIQPGIHNLGTCWSTTQTRRAKALGFQALLASAKNSGCLSMAISNLCYHQAVT